MRLAEAGLDGSDLSVCAEEGLVQLYSLQGIIVLAPPADTGRACFIGLEVAPVETDRAPADRGRTAPG